MGLRRWSTCVRGGLAGGGEMQTARAEMQRCRLRLGGLRCQLRLRMLRCQENLKALIPCEKW